MKKFFSLVLALVMALSLTTVAWGADASVGTETELKNALSSAADGDTITLTGNITVTATTIGSQLVGIEVPAGVSINGNGFTLTVDGAYDAAGGTHCAVLFHGGTLENITIVGGNRCLYVTNVQEDIILNKVVLVTEGSYGINVNDGDAPLVELKATNSVFSGWNSYGTAVTKATFEGCEFVFNTAGTYAVLRPYNETVVEDCSFVDGAELSLDELVAGETVSMDECTYAGIPVSDDNMARLFGLSASDAANVVTTNSTTAALYDLYEGDDDLYLDGAFRTKVAAKKLTKTQAGQVAGWDIEGTLYVEITKAEATQADYYLTKHGKDDAIMYLREAENHGVYTLTGKAYDNFNEGDDNCGEWNYDPELVAMYKDDVDGDIYTDQGTTAYMLVGKTVVGVELADEDKMVDHQMEGVYDAKDKLVGVKCAVCGATGKVYESVAKVPFGADYDFFDGLPYVLNKVAVKPADTETKVESAETFDAGIAMYVGMSVMAAAGSAVVIGKKKD